MAKRIVSLLCALCLMAPFAPPLTMSAKAASNAVLPLPGDKSYSVSVLSKYSNGTAHSSYITQFVLGGSSTSRPECVMDITAAKDTAVYAIMDGTIHENNSHTNGGYNVVIKHTDGSYSYYGHLRDRSPKARGTTIKRGDVIGYVGMSGQSTGYHLHFE